MDFEPIQVKLRLGTPLAVDMNPLRSSLCLDALLSGIMAARGRDLTDLPIERRDGLAVASQMFVRARDTSNGDLFPTMQRTRAADRAFNRDATLLRPYRRKPGFVSAGTGNNQVKVASTQYRAIPETSWLLWFAHGNLDAVRALVAWLVAPDGTPGYGVGRSAGAGGGEIVDAKVLPLPVGMPDASLVLDGLPTRPIPVQRWSQMGHSQAGVAQATVSWQYPYHRTPRALCVIPTTQYVVPGMFGTRPVPSVAQRSAS